MKVFGLTGGIGMGKSAAEQSLRDRGVPTIDTDLLARDVVAPGRPALQEIQQAFGKHFVGAGGQLRRDELAELVFNDRAARLALERITHPRIRERWRQQVEAWRGEGKALAIVVIPLLFETTAESDFDATVCVACSAATQQRRLQERGWTPRQAAQRIGSQWPIEKKMARADYVVWTEGGLELLAPQMDRIFA